MNTMIIKYAVKNGQYTWSGKTDLCNFAAVAANGLNDLRTFCTKHFPGREIKLVAD